MYIDSKSYTVRDLVWDPQTLNYTVVDNYYKASIPSYATESWFVLGLTDQFECDRYVYNVKGEPIVYVNRPYPFHTDTKSDMPVLSSDVNFNI